MSRAGDVLKRVGIISEGKKYPTQQDAEFLREIMDFVETLSRGGLSPEHSKLLDKLQSIHMPLWDKTFGDKSPWKLERKGNKKKVVWDNEKAKQFEGVESVDTIMGMLEAKKLTDKEAAEKMKSKGYKFIMIAKNANKWPVLFAKTPQMVADWLKEYKDLTFDTMKIDDYMALPANHPVRKQIKPKYPGG